MLTGDVWGVTLIVVGLIVTIAALEVLIATVFPSRVARTRALVTRRAWLSALIGLPLAVVAVAVSVGAGKVPGGLVVGSLLMFAGLMGRVAVATELGARMAADGDAAPPWRTALRGSLTLSLASFLPMAGWFLVFPLSFGIGLGALVRSLFVRAPAGDAADAGDTAAIGDAAAAPANPALGESVA